MAVEPDADGMPKDIVTRPEFPFPVRLRPRLPVYGGRVGLAVRRTLQGALVVHLDGAGDVWEGSRPTAWLRGGEYDVLGDETAMTSEGEAK